MNASTLAPSGNGTAHGNGHVPNGAVLVCGGGVAGIQAALDLSAAGFAVYLVEESPTIGGSMARLDKTFPTGDCATCIISPKLVQCMRDHNIEVLTMPDVRRWKARRGPSGRGPAPPARRHLRQMHRLRRLLERLPRARRAPADAGDATRRAFDGPGRFRGRCDPGPLPRRPGPAYPRPSGRDRTGPLSAPPGAGYVAMRLKISLAEILRVASFYNAFSLSPVGRHTIEICLGTACFVRGSGLLLDRLEQE